ncbi:MAG: hypothetical protein HOI41_18970 [Acidimicrobiaceae bacterium]|nr:hypothetical protein [Acidimicrobiaceae bacterium]
MRSSTTYKIALRRIAIHHYSAPSWLEARATRFIGPRAIECVHDVDGNCRAGAGGRMEAT